jgi:hypothetical protein
MKNPNIFQHLQFFPTFHEDNLVSLLMTSVPPDIRLRKPDYPAIFGNPAPVAGE